jgi:threonine aldolase
MNWRRSAAARAKGLKLHMDGRVSPMRWRSGLHPGGGKLRGGVDALSFGCVKNGGMSAEALVYFDLAGRRREVPPQARGHLQSKGRFLAAQILAMLKGDLWLANGARRQCRRAQIASGVADRLLHPVEANEVFLRLSRRARRPARAGLRFL